MANEIRPIAEGRVVVPANSAETYTIDDFYIEFDEVSLYDISTFTFVLPTLDVLTVVMDGGASTSKYRVSLIDPGLVLFGNAVVFIKGQNSAYGRFLLTNTAAPPVPHGTLTSVVNNKPVDGTWTIYWQSNYSLLGNTVRIKCGPLYFEKVFSDLAGLGAVSDYVTIWNAHLEPTLIESGLPAAADAQNTRHYSDAQQDATAATAPRSIRPPLLLPKQPSRSVVGGAMAQEYAKVPDSGYYVEFSTYYYFGVGDVITFIAPNGDAISCVRTDADSTNIPNFPDQRFTLDGTFVSQRNPQHWVCTSTITPDTPVDGTWQIIIICSFYVAQRDSALPYGTLPVTINLGSFGRYTLEVNFAAPQYFYRIWNAHEGSFDEDVSVLLAPDVTNTATGPAQVNAANFRFYDSYGATATELPNVMDLLPAIVAPDAPSTDRPPVLVFDPDYSETVKSGIFSKGAA